MKKKFSFFDKLKDKFKRSQKLEEDDQVEYELDEESSDEDADEDEELDEDYTPRPMTFSRDEKKALDDDLDQTQPQATQPPPLESTREMQRPTPEELDEYDQRERFESIRQNASQEDDFEEHSGINHYREFELPRSSSPKKGKLKSWLQQIPWKTGVPKWKRGTSLSKEAKPSFHWDHFVREVFHVNQRPRIQKVFLVLFICFSAFAGGKLAGLYLDSGSSSAAKSPSPIMQIPEQIGEREIQNIARVDLFNTYSEKGEEDNEPVKQEPQVDRNLICLSAQRSSDLPIELMNTVVLQDSIKSVASVQVRGQKEVMDIREGQKITNIAEVGRIDRQKLIFKNLNNGECEYVANEKNEGKGPKSFNIVSEDQGQKLMQSQADTAIKNEGNNFSIKKSLRDQMLNNISEVLTQAKAVQIQNPDGSYSFKMTDIIPGSIYSKLNIENGDIIERIDGEKIEDLNAVMTKFGRIREIDNLSLTIKKDGASQTYDYSFE